MSKAIEVNNVYKQYRLGLVGTGSLQDDATRFFAKLRGKEDPFLKIGEKNDRTTISASGYTWALRDINFDVNQGEVMGVIGKNGAGKSTLLKLMSRVTSPTKGEIKMKGRVASLLEVGTGFHPELTGRENIFLNGAILGMRKKEINQKLDEIISFSGVERYIDTPVKRYSSGMHVRLAFSVAAHLEAEIMIIDEVLAVGDAEFQKKCLGKMKDVSSGQGRTVLFVSHNMAAVKSLCDRAILLENGEVVLNGDTDSCIQRYLVGEDKEAGLNYTKFVNKGITGLFNLMQISIQNKGKELEAPVTENSTIELITEFELNSEESGRYIITYHLVNELGDAIFSFSSGNKIKLENGINNIVAEIPEYFLQSGKYSLHMFLIEDSKRAVFHESDIFSFTVVDGKRDIGVYMGREPGYIRPNFNWKHA